MSHKQGGLIDQFGVSLGGDLKDRLLILLLLLSKSKYASAILKRFNMSNFKPALASVIIGLKLSKDDDGSTAYPTLFKRIVGSLMYLKAMRPDIMYGVSLISRVMESPKNSH